MVEEHQSLRHRLAELNALLPILRREQRGIRRTLNALKYPVLDLPPEITAEIFLCCLPPLQSTYPYILYPSVARAPLLLLRVCRAWREIALETPQLWTSIQMSWSFAEAPMELEKWILRTGSSPLSLGFSGSARPSEFIERARVISTLWANDFQSSQEPPAQADAAAPVVNPNFAIYDRVLQRLLDSSYRWCDLDFTDKHSEFVSYQAQLTSALHGKLPLLQRLKIGRRWSHQHCHFNAFKYGFADPDPDITIFQDAPQLRDVSITQLLPSMVVIPWAQLTTFNAENFSVEDCLHVLKLTPVLVSCSFGFLVRDPRRNDWDDPEQTTKIPPLVHLESLILYGTSEVRLDDLISPLTCTLPALTKLHQLRLDEEILVDFLARSAPPLRELSVGAYYHEPHELALEGLPLMPHLSVLLLGPVPFDHIELILRSLRDSAAFIPNLESLDVTLDTPKRSQSEPADPPVARFNYVALVGALSARRAQPLFAKARLERFRLTWLEPTDFAPSEYMTEEDVGVRPSSDIVDRLSDFVDEGMEFYLGSKHLGWMPAGINS
ncbi:hypothetical protein C8R46DRAFT_1192370 [Mycena filopes]|nr:hypothetical protein C8R46DRAFT_1192370 [Mycena filopes]